jgi:hypothetical protein
MNTLDAQLASRLHEMVDGEVGAEPPTGILLTRGRRARHRRAAAVVTASLAVLTVGGVAATVTVQPSTPNRPAVTAAEAPKLQLVAAVAASENVSYQVKVTATSKPVSDTGAETTVGAFDPETATGFLNSSQSTGGVVYLERLIDGVRFVSSSGSKDKWKQYPGKHDRLAYDRALNSAVGASADPKQLFETLRRAGAKVTQNGAGVYHFEVEQASDTFVGDVVLGADKRIAKVTYERTSRHEKGGQTSTSTNLVTVELSGYGLPVRVQQPTDVIIVK